MPETTILLVISASGRLRPAEIVTKKSVPCCQATPTVLPTFFRKKDIP